MQNSQRARNSTLTGTQQSCHDSPPQTIHKFYSFIAFLHRVLCASSFQVPQHCWFLQLWTIPSRASQELPVARLAVLTICTFYHTYFHQTIIRVSISTDTLIIIIIAVNFYTNLQLDVDVLWSAYIRKSYLKLQVHCVPKKGKQQTHGSNSVKS